MEQTEPLIAARQIIATAFPSARAAFIGGSSVTPRRTEYSDLDLVIVLDDIDACYRETIRAYGWLVELFVHNEATLRHYWNLDVESRRPALIRMCAKGCIVSVPERRAVRIQREARRLLAAGPPPLLAEELTYRRYILTDLLDDYLGCRDPREDVFIAATLLTASTELALLAAGAWLGSGKWLARELAATDPELGAAITSAYRAAVTGGSKEPLAQVVRDVLALVGGPLGAGYKSQGVPLPPQ